VGRGGWVVHATAASCRNGNGNGNEHGHISTWSIGTILIKVAKIIIYSVRCSDGAGHGSMDRAVMPRTTVQVTIGFPFLTNRASEPEFCFSGGLMNEGRLVTGTGTY
jgi:hypothetical protein